MIPGEVLTPDRDVELCEGRPTIRISVSNTGDRPVQVGSHYHFYETNAALSFDRKAAYGYRLSVDFVPQDAPKPKPVARPQRKPRASKSVSPSKGRRAAPGRGRAVARPRRRGAAPRRRS